MTARATAPTAAWHLARVAEVHAETASARRIVLEVPDWPGNDAGAHVDVRLTAPDGYTATRSYSLASSGDGTRVALAVDEVAGGEVSPFLVHELQPGDTVEVHGPLGAFFVWRPDGDVAPVQLIAGGSGIVPLYAMAEAHARAEDASVFRLLYSVRTPEDVYFAAEWSRLLAAPAPLSLDFAYTRRAPEGWPASPARLTAGTLTAASVAATERPRVFVCGPTRFVEAVAGWLVDAGHEPGRIRTERFGGA